MMAPELKIASGRPAVGGGGVDQGRHAVVGVHGQERGLELVASADVAGDDLVGDAELLEQDGDLLAVGVGE
jgi:hypothetical protein